MRSAFAPVVLPVVAVIAALVRWWMQGSGNLYTATSKQSYVKDPDFGWVVGEDRPIWLGLEVCGVILAVACALAVGGWIIRRRERKTARPAKVLRGAAWIAGAVTLAVPIAAFASGSRPAGAVDVLPKDTVRAPTAAGIAGALAAPAGRYEVVAHAGTSITATLKAGSEEFDARFASDITGTWQGDPRELAKPMTAVVTAAAAAVDTGIAGRTTSARDTYLAVAKYPHITFTLTELVTAQQDRPDQVAFRAHGTLGLLGESHAIEVVGTLRKPDATALAAKQLTGEILFATADLTLVVKDTALAKYAGDFDTDVIPIHISLVLRHASN